MGATSTVGRTPTVTWSRWSPEAEAVAPVAVLEPPHPTASSSGTPSSAATFRRIGSPSIRVVIRPPGAGGPIIASGRGGDPAGGLVPHRPPDDTVEVARRELAGRSDGLQ